MPVHALEGMTQEGPAVHVGDACPYHQGVRRPSQVTEDKAILSILPEDDTRFLASLSQAFPDR